MKAIKNEFEATEIIIDLFDKSILNQEQINNTIIELIEFYNLENFIKNYLEYNNESN